MVINLYKFPLLLKGPYLLLPLAYIHTKILYIPEQSIILMNIFLGGLRLRIYW